MSILYVVRCTRHRAALLVIVGVGIDNDDNLERLELQENLLEKGGGLEFGLALLLQAKASLLARREPCRRIACRVEEASKRTCVQNPARALLARRGNPRYIRSKLTLLTRVINRMQIKSTRPSHSIVRL